MAKGRKTGGRVAGTLNKATRDIKEAARAHGPAAIKKLASLMESADSDTAKISAAKELLDRAYGKATQPLASDPESPFQVQVIERRIVRADPSDR